ncbi:MAG TPA: hypothetical protein ENO20_15090 [Bacteroides sp.]|nr:hypothetical protein [Bacteroides sp.]
MKKYRFVYIIPVILSLAITIGLVRLVPVLSTKYMMEVVRTERLTEDDYRHYVDLDGDGTSERISLYYNAAGNLAVSVNETDNRSINQFNLPGRLLTLGPALDMHDVNSDGILDMLICTENNDSLFLTLIDDLYARPTRKKEVFIDRLNRMNDHGDYQFLPGKWSDLSRDGVSEYVFAVSGGHALQPRCVYAVDFRSAKVLRSPESGAALIGLGLFDLDGDGGDEILLNTFAPENFKTPVPYSDSVSWIMVLDGSLHFYKPPIEMNPAPSRVYLEPFVLDDSNYVLAYYKYLGNENYPSVLCIYDDALTPVRERQFFESENSPFMIWSVPGRLHINDIKIFKGSRVYTVDFDLYFADSIDQIIQSGNSYKNCLDLDLDGEEEVICVGGFRIAVFNADFVESAGISVEWDTRRPKILTSVIETKGMDPLLFAQIGTYTYTLDYSRNGWYRYRLLVYPSIFMGLSLLFCLMVVLQQRIIERKYEKDRLISRLQLQAIRNQLDPHFTFNALNAVGSLIYKEKKELAYDYLKGLTDLLRLVSSNPSEVTWTLEEELGFIRKYLEIEKLRFRDKFSYLIDATAECQYHCQVPKLSILTFVENAIKHGLRHKQGAGRLEIRITGNKKKLMVQVEDNGIGRAATTEYPDGSAGNGLDMMKRYFKQFNQVTGRKSRFVIRDLYDEQQMACGTLIEITIQ